MGFTTEPHPPLVDKRLSRSVLMRDARAQPFRLSTSGFEMRRWPTKVHDFQDTSTVKRKYRREVEALVLEAIAGSNASAAVVWDLCLRDSGLSNELQVANDADDGDDGGLDLLAPVPLVHVDFYSADDVYQRLSQRAERPTDTLSSYMPTAWDEHGLAPTDIRRHVEAGRRVVSLNVWRSIDASHPIERDALALCDPRSVRVDDRVPFMLRCPDVEFSEAHVLADHAAEHAWYCYPRMTHDECLLFVSGDTAERWPSVPHTSFAGNSAEARPRRSIEARVFVLFDDESDQRRQ